MFFLNIFGPNSVLVEPLKIDLTFANFVKRDVVKPYFNYGCKVVAVCSLYFYYRFGLNSKRLVHGDVEYFGFYEN